VVGFLSAPGDERYARVTEPREIDFPADEGAHDAYQTEWWYYTGNLAGTDGRRFGFQLTFFRRAVAPAELVQPRDSDWATGQIYLAHFTVTDVEAGSFHSAERLARGAAGLAGAEADPYRVWVEAWEARSPRMAGPDARGGWDRPQRLRAADGPVALDLRLRPIKAPALHGQRGFSPKGSEPGNASYYYSYTRLEAEGSLTTAEGDFAVEGLAWMDHEWSTSALSESQVGWDWFSLQLDDGRELMAFQVREAGDGVSPESSGSLVEPDGSLVPLGREDFELLVRDRWTSPRTLADYPAGWTLRLPEADLELEIEPQLKDQELDVSLQYWEGSVRVRGSSRGEPIAGYGYVELTGYAGLEGALPGLD
jgi:predicted secreted hydrolase